MTDPRQSHPAPVSATLANRSNSQVLSELFGDPLEPGYAEASARRAAGDLPPPRRGPRMLLLVVVAVVGLLLAVAYQQVVAEQPTRSQVNADLEAQIHDRQAENQRLQERVEQLREDVTALRDRQLDDPAEVRRLRDLEAVTGLGPVTGDGLVVRVADGPPAGVDPDTGEPAVDPQARILYRDLQHIANALWAAGAEAIAVNDHRLTATSTIRSASGAILVDRAPVAGPYRVVALGPDDLAERFAATEAAQLMQLLVHKFGIEYDVHSESGLRVPAASDPQLHHATPVPDR